MPFHYYPFLIFLVSNISMLSIVKIFFGTIVLLKEELVQGVTSFHDHTKRRFLFVSIIKFI